LAGAVVDELPAFDLAESQLVQAALASLASEDGRAGAWTLVGFANSGGLVFMDESAQEVAAA
jgi:hypothetical protein